MATILPPWPRSPPTRTSSYRPSPPLLGPCSPIPHQAARQPPVTPSLASTAAPPADRRFAVHGPEIGSRIDGLLEVLWKASGTDLLLTAGMPPQIRVHGELRPVPGQGPLTASATDALVAEVLLPEQAAIWK